MFTMDATALTPGSLTPIETRMNIAPSFRVQSFVPSQGVSLQLEDGAARVRAQLSTTTREATGLPRPPASAPNTRTTTPLAHNTNVANTQPQGSGENQQSDRQFPSDRNDPSWWRIIFREVCRIFAMPRNNNSRVLRERHHRHCPPQLLRQVQQGVSIPPAADGDSQLSAKQTLTQALAMQRCQQHQQAVGEVVPGVCSAEVLHAPQ